VSPLGGGPTPSIMMLAAPSDATSALGISCTGASYVGSSDTRDSSGATTGRGEPEMNMARSPTLTVDDSTRGRHWDVFRCTTGR
jgi:hypothetical protein